MLLWPNDTVLAADPVHSGTLGSSAPLWQSVPASFAITLARVGALPCPSPHQQAPCHQVWQWFLSYRNPTPCWQPDDAQSRESVFMLMPPLYSARQEHPHYFLWHHEHLQLKGDKHTSLLWTNNSNKCLSHLLVVTVNCWCGLKTVDTFHNVKIRNPPVYGPSLKTLQEFCMKSEYWKRQLCFLFYQEEIIREGRQRRGEEDKWWILKSSASCN